MRAWAGSWLAGLIFGLAGTWVMIAMFAFGIPLFIVMLVPFLLQSRRRAAAAGAVLLAMSAWFAYYEWTGFERCAEMNRRPNASCQIFDVAPTVLSIALLALAGVLISIWSARKASSSHGDAFAGSST